MMTTVPTKIVLKSTTRMSLNDRFSNITPTIQNIRANIAAEQQVSAANRRLAQQLAHRPGLQAAGPSLYQVQQPFRGARQGNIHLGPNRKSLQQRLGRGSIKNRLSLPPGQQPLRGRGRGQGRGVLRSPQNGAGDSQWVINRGKDRGGFSPRGPRGRGVFRGRGRGTFNRVDENSQVDGSHGGRGRGYTDRFAGQNAFIRQGRGNARGNRRGMRRGGRGQLRGRGAAGRGGGSNVTVQDLDSQLDEYMTKSRSQLDAQLDAYMSEVNN